MSSTTTYRRGHVVVVDVPFSNHSGVKPRPALVVSATSFHRVLPDMIVCPISSQQRYYDNPGLENVPLQDWQETRLLFPSTVRVSKILSVDKRIIRRVLGSVSARDLARVQALLRKALELK